MSTRSEVRDCTAGKRPSYRSLTGQERSVKVTQLRIVGVRAAAAWMYGFPHQARDKSPSQLTNAVIVYLILVS